MHPDFQNTLSHSFLSPSPFFFFPHLLLLSSFSPLYPFLLPSPSFSSFLLPPCSHVEWCPAGSPPHHGHQQQPVTTGHCPPPSPYHHRHRQEMPENRAYFLAELRKTIIFVTIIIINSSNIIIIIITRSYAVLWAADVGWIIGPQYSLDWPFFYFISLVNVTIGFLKFFLWRNVRDRQTNRRHISFFYGFSWFQVSFSWFQVGFHGFAWKVLSTLLGKLSGPFLQKD